MLAMDALPNEVLINILCHLNTLDLIRFCDAFPNYYYFLEEKSIVRKVDYSKRFEIADANIIKCITQRIEYRHIEVLRIEGLYWIAAQQLRKFIKTLPNLRELYALDTRLALEEDDLLVYNKLNKLSVTFSRCNTLVLERNRFMDYPIKFLFIKYINNGFQVEVLPLLINNLEELWIYKDCGIMDISSIESVKKLRKIVLIGEIKMYMVDEFRQQFNVYFTSCSERHVIMEKFQPAQQEVVRKSVFDPNYTELEEAWDILYKLGSKCGPKACRKLYFNNDINKIYFEDLYLPVECYTNPKYIKAAMMLLTSKNSSNLKRLAISSCIFSDKVDTYQGNEIAVFKKTRIGMRVIPNHPFKEVCDNLKTLKQLEITGCMRCFSSSVISGYPTIALFATLESLTIDGAFLWDGSSLQEILIKCDKLKSLSIICTCLNEKLTINLCQALKHATSLRDLRFAHINIDVDRLFESLNVLEGRKLLRLFVESSSFIISTKNQNAIQNFLEKNPQLILFYIIADHATLEQLRYGQTILNHSANGGLAKVFRIAKEIKLDYIPSVHHDIIRNHSSVSVINVEEF